MWPHYRNNQVVAIPREFLNKLYYDSPGLDASGRNKQVAALTRWPLGQVPLYIRTIDEHRKHLKLLKYPNYLLEDWLQRLKFNQRETLLQEKETSNKGKVLPFVMKYESSNPHPKSSHWDTLYQQPRNRAIYPQQPIVCYTRTRNLKDILVKAKFWSISLPNMTSFPFASGLPESLAKRCGISNCGCCPVMLPRNTITSSSNGNQYHLESSIKCTTENVVYMIECIKCGKQYIGETIQTLAKRLRHRRNSYGKENRMLYNQFHNDSHEGGFYKWTKVSPIKHLPGADQRRMKAAETDFIQFFNTFYANGLNSRKSLVRRLK